jgi:inhibitor of KinA
VNGSPFRLVNAGDSVVIVELADRIDEAINAQALRLAAVVDAAAIPGIADVVPTYRSVAVYFDPLRTDYAALSDLLTRTATGLQRPAEEGRDAPRAAPIRIPVQYGGEHGPDLTDVAAFARLSEDDVVARHLGRVYRVFMMGFVPGFPYLGTVDPAIAAPRRPSPRLRVPAGSVGIAGAQTGIYPAETPGGWQIIGRTGVRLFDLSRAEPFLLKPGDLVQFYQVQ